MPVRAGAEPYSAEGGRVGVLLCHGFTGSPASLRPWAEALGDAGHSVELPLLPGHGTQWQDMQPTRWRDWYTTVEQSLMKLLARCDNVFVMGLSMGGTLALRLAEQHGDAIAGLVVVNPSVHSHSKMLQLLPAVRRVVPSFGGVRNDIKKQGVDELAYDRIPLQALQSLTELWELVSKDLPKISQPLVVYGSEIDHVVEPCNGREVAEKVSSRDRLYVSLSESFHVATLDNDAPTIIDGSLRFISRLTDAPHRGESPLVPEVP